MPTLPLSSTVCSFWFVMETPIQTQIRLPGKYHKQPVISRLTSRYGLTVNITAASLISGAYSEGWFNIELSGNPEKLTNSLSYLQVLGIDLLQLEIANHLKPSQISTILKNFNSNEAVLNKQRLQTQSNITQKLHEYIYNSQFTHSTKIANHNTIRLKLKLGIFKRYQHKPIISELVSNFGLTVNIVSALLADDIYDDGLFELEIWGELEQVYLSLRYLEQLGLSLLVDASPESVSEDLIY